MTTNAIPNFRRRLAAAAVLTLMVAATDRAASAHVAAPAVPLIQVKQGSAIVTPGVTFQLGSTLFRTSLTRVFTIRNTGFVQLSISNVTVAGASYSTSIKGPVPQLAPGQTYSFGVQFSGTPLGTSTGCIAIYSNAANTPTFHLLVSARAWIPRPPRPQPPYVTHAVPTWDAIELPAVALYARRSPALLA